MKYILLKKYILENDDTYYDKIISFDNLADAEDMKVRLKKMYSDDIFEIAKAEQKG